MRLHAYFKLIDRVCTLNRSVEKLLLGLVSETYSHEFEETLPFPSLTFCPFLLDYDVKSFAEAEWKTPLIPNLVLNFTHYFNDR